MCLVVPYRVVALAPGAVSVRMGDEVRAVFAEPELSDVLVVGDHVLVSGGVAVRRLDPAQAEVVSAAAAIAYGTDERDPLTSPGRELP